MFARPLLLLAVFDFGFKSGFVESRRFESSAKLVKRLKSKWPEMEGCVCYPDIYWPKLKDEQEKVNLEPSQRDLLI